MSNKQKLIIGVVMAVVLVLTGMLASVAFAKPAWKEVTCTYPEVDVPIDIDGDGIADNNYIVGLYSDGSINVMYYHPDEYWDTATGITVVGTESYIFEGKGRKNKDGEWRVYDAFPWPNPDQWTHPLILDKQ